MYLHAFCAQIYISFPGTYLGGLATVRFKAAWEGLSFRSLRGKSSSSTGEGLVPYGGRSGTGAAPAGGAFGVPDAKKPLALPDLGARNNLTSKQWDCHIILLSSIFPHVLANFTVLAESFFI